MSDETDSIAPASPAPASLAPASLAPGPRPGFRSRVAIRTSDKASLVATLLRSLVGVVCLFVAVLYLPPQPVTPILTGVSVLMIVSGGYAAWQVARREPRLSPYARVVYWGCPALGVVVFLLMLVVGAGALGPDWRALPGAEPPSRDVRFVPADE